MLVKGAPGAFLSIFGSHKNWLMNLNQNQYNMDSLFALLALCEGIPPVIHINLIGNMTYTSLRWICFRKHENIFAFHNPQMVTVYNSGLAADKCLFSYMMNNGHAIEWAKTEVVTVLT